MKTVLISPDGRHHEFYTLKKNAMEIDNAKLFEVLKDLASKHSTISYSEVASLLGLHVKLGARSTGRYGHIINIFCEDNNLPRINHLIVGKDSNVASSHASAPGTPSQRQAEQQAIYNFNWSSISPSYQDFVQAIRKNCVSY